MFGLLNTEWDSLLSCFHLLYIHLNPFVPFLNCALHTSSLPPTTAKCFLILGGGYHAGECGQGFGKGPEAFRAG